MSKINVAIIGVGNCASSLVQGVHYYKDAKEGEQIPGLMHINLGGYHISDIESIFKKFYSLLNAGGYLAIADLFPEDGSFHGLNVQVHLGFEPEKLKETLSSIGFKNIEYTTCFEMKRESGKKFPVFLLVAKK